MNWPLAARWLDTDTAATVAKCTPEEIRAAVRAGHLKGVTGSGRLAFRLKWLRAWQKSGNTVRPQSRLPVCPRQLPDSTRGYVYFIATADMRFVKIGWPRSAQRRWKELQSFHPEPLRLLATFAGGMGQEARWHRRFAHLSAVDEWFRLDDELKTAISAETAVTVFGAEVCA